VILPFGAHRGEQIEDVPEDYLKWLAKPKPYTKNIHSSEIKWSVPVTIRMEARRILENRGYRIIGERIERVDT
jgi:hypothetical protein